MNYYQLKKMETYFMEQTNKRHFHFFFIMSSLLIILSLILTSCKKFVEVEAPKTELVSSLVFSNDASAKASMDGIYSRMMQGVGFASGSDQCVAALTGLSSDELINYSTNQELLQFYQNALDKTNSRIQTSIWAEPYKYIYTTNAIIEGLSKAANLSNSVKQQLMGEAKFIRAFCYFYLLNMFGDVPLYLTTDYRTSSVSFRAPKAQVYQQVIADLKDAQSILPGDYSLSNYERIRPNKWAAIAMLARAYLFLGDWVNAEAQATAVINNSMYNLASNLNQVFLKNSTEAIWQLMPNQPGFNTNEGRYSILYAAPTNNALSNQLTNSFEVGDNRKVSWVGSVTIGTNTYYFPYKYKVQSGNILSEYSMVLRLAEQYLIRGESRANQGNIIGSQSDLNLLRTRAGLPNTTATSQSELVKAFLHERQVELFTEWGHRWLDLKRTNKTDSVLGPIKGANWQPTDSLYPIPLQEIQNNSHITQNPGY